MSQPETKSTQSKSRQSKSKAKDKVSPPSLSADEPRYLNRELAWLEFNSRVLDQADDETVKLLERAKFLAITGSNLDEFMMVRVGSLKLQSRSGSGRRDPANLTAAEQLQAVARRCHRHVARQYEILNDQVQPRLADERITRIDLNQCSDRMLAAGERHFHGDVVAVLSPQALHDRRFP